MKYKVLISFFYIFIVSLALCANEKTVNERKIESKAPDGFERLATSIKSYTDVDVKEGHHGLLEYCYKKNTYIVYAENFLGDGYIISKESPKGFEETSKGLVCTETTKEIIEKNKLGIHIGMSKSSVENLIKVYNLSDKQIIWWSSIKEIHELPYDVQTYAKFIFENDILVYIEVFTTITS